MRALAIVLSFCFPLSTAFYFHAGEREEKCIIEDIPSDTLITGRWGCPGPPPAPDVCTVGSERHAVRFPLDTVYPVVQSQRERV